MSKCYDICQTCQDGDVVCDTCDSCNERHCQDCEPCTSDLGSVDYDGEGNPA